MQRERVVLNLNDMVLFSKVAELQGISSAARELNIPKSRVSRRLATLEEELGVRLLERTTRAVHLTEMGNIFWQHCQRIVEEAESAEESLNQMMNTPRGLLRISASVATGQYLIAPHLGEFSETYPEISIDLELNNRRVDLISEGFDLAVRVGELDDSNLISRKLGEGKAHLCAAPAYVKQYGAPKSVRDLNSHRQLVMSGSSLAAQWLLEKQTGKSESVNVRPNICINDMTALRTLVETGAGVAALPDYLIRDGIANKRIVRLLPEWSSPTFEYYVLYPSRKGLTRKARAWVEFFVERLKRV